MATSIHYTRHYSDLIDSIYDRQDYLQRTKFKRCPLHWYTEGRYYIAHPNCNGCMHCNNKFTWASNSWMIYKRLASVCVTIYEVSEFCNTIDHMYWCIKRVYEILANVAYLLRLALKFLTRKLRIVNICLYQKPKHNPKIITWHSLFKVTYLKYLVRRVILLIYRVE